MRSAFFLLATAACAIAAPSKTSHVVRQGIQCTPVDDDGTALTGSSASGDFVTCTYAGAGPCTYFPADGSFSSGGSSCPAGIAQDPSVTTAGASSATDAPASSTSPEDPPESESISRTNTNDTPSSIPGVPAPSSTPSTPSSLPGVPAPSSSGTTPSQSLPGVPAPSPSASQPGGALGLHTTGMASVLVAVGLGFLAL
ncbi:hypothetical protein C8R43DRAFT_1231804 [Mycena crocata]|nr:hypothetical protein C8R43DRAFT_1231804 [Mycena crocata]